MQLHPDDHCASSWTHTSCACVAALAIAREVHHVQLRGGDARGRSSGVFFEKQKSDRHQLRVGYDVNLQLCMDVSYVVACGCPLCIRLDMLQLGKRIAALAIAHEMRHVQLREGGAPASSS